MTTPQQGPVCYAVPKGTVEPGNERSYGYRKIMDIMHRLEPGDVHSAGDAFISLSEKLDSLRGALQSAGDALASNGSWKGQAASAAMNHFQQLHDQTAQLSAQSQTAGNTLHWLGGDVMPKFQSIPSPTVASGTEQALSSFMNNGIEAFMGDDVNGQRAADQAAQQYLRTFNGHLATASAAMPSNLAAPGQQSTSWATPSGNHAGSSSGGSGSGTGSGSAGVPGSNALGGTAASAGGGAGVPGYASPSSSSANPFSAAKLPHTGTSPTPANAGLQSYSPPASGGANPFAGGSSAGAGGGSANPFSSMGMMPGSGSGYGGSGGASGEDGAGEDGAVGEDALKAAKGTLPGEDGAASGEGAAAEGSAGSEAAGSEAAGAAGAEGEGVSGMPMGGMGGGGGSQDQERQRQAWMNEDQSIWGVPQENIGSVLE